MPSPPPPFTLEEKNWLDFECKVAFSGFSLHTITQIQHIACPWSEKWQRLLSIVFTALIWAFPLLTPRFYINYRDLILLVFKLIFFAFPLLRQAKGIQRVLDAPATPGSIGFLIDIIKMGWGSRLFASSLCGLALAENNIWLQVIAQVYSMLMVRGNDSLCASQLMTDPLTVRRVRFFSVLSTEALLPGFAMSSIVAIGKDCSFIFTLLHLLFSVAAPTLPLVLRHRKFRRLDARGKLVLSWVGLALCWATAIVITLYLNL